MERLRACNDYCRAGRAMLLVDKGRRAKAENGCIAPDHGLKTGTPRKPRRIACVLGIPHIGGLVAALLVRAKRWVRVNVRWNLLTGLIRRAWQAR